jgi:hypothetical protein
MRAASSIPEFLFRVVLALAGLAVAFTGVNVAGGGIATLGLQGGTEFFAVTDAHEFAVHDSHVRFLGGLWLGVGLLFLVGAVRLPALLPAIRAAFVLTLVGGLARLTAGQPDIVFGPEIAPSLGAEVILMPALLAWSFFLGRRSSPPADVPR